METTFLLWDFISEGYSQQCILYLSCCQVTFKDRPLPLGLHPHVTVLRRMLELYPTCHWCALYWEIISQHLGIVEQCFESKLALTSNSAEDFFRVFASTEMKTLLLPVLFCGFCFLFGWWFFFYLLFWFSLCF